MNYSELAHAAVDLIMAALLLMQSVMTIRDVNRSKRIAADRRKQAAYRDTYYEVFRRMAGSWENDDL